jgi:hypothetical protein
MQTLFAALALLRTRSRLGVEILALRHRLGVLERSVRRPRSTHADRGAPAVTIDWTTPADGYVVTLTPS